MRLLETIKDQRNQLTWRETRRTQDHINNTEGLTLGHPLSRKFLGGKFISTSHKGSAEDVVKHMSDGGLFMICLIPNFLVGPCP